MRDRLWEWTGAEGLDGIKVMPFGESPIHLYSVLSHSGTVFHGSSSPSAAHVYTKLYSV